MGEIDQGLRRFAVGQLDQRGDDNGQNQAHQSELNSHAGGRDCVFRGKSATDSEMKSATDSDLITAIPI